MSKSRGRPGRDLTSTSVQISVGSILWLPAKEKVDGSFLPGSNIDDGGFNHPFFVFSLDSPRKMAVGFLLTSFNGQDLMKRFPDDARSPSFPKLRQNHLPISPSAVHPDLGILLVLQGRRMLRANSYINTGKRVTINCGALEPYDRDGTRYKIEPESFKVLRAHVNGVSLPVRPVLRDISNPPSLPPDQQPSYPTSSVQSTQPVDLYRLLAERYPPGTVSPIKPPPRPIPRTRSFNTPLPVIRESWEERQMYGIRTRNERTPLLPQTNAPIRAQKSFSCATVTRLIFFLIFWSLVAYGAAWVYLLLRSR